jgi:hypothetical protein
LFAVMARSHVADLSGKRLLTISVMASSNSAGFVKLIYGLPIREQSAKGWTWKSG